MSRIMVRSHLPVRRGHQGSARDASRLRLPHFPALDGLRGLALFFVLLFHSGFDFVQAGYLPLSSFFVLSGFLITALLLLEQQRNGRIDLRAFWRRRAKRLVPGMLLGLALVAVYVQFGARTDVPGLLGDVVATLTWVTNWRFITNGAGYEDIFTDPSPLQHFWSLAVEEQFYLVLPLVVVGSFAWRGRRMLAGIAGAGILVSTVLMQRLHVPDETPLRAYLGTDTRAAELLIGVLLAMVVVGPNGRRRLRRRTRRYVDYAGTVGLAILVYSWVRVPEYADWIFAGGLQLLALVAAVVVLAATDRRSQVAQLLSIRPLVQLGTISYGVYLYHWPIFLWLGADNTGLDGWPLFALRFSVSVGLAAASYRLIERPIRFNELVGRPALVAWANAAVAVVAVAAIAASGLTGTFDDIPLASTAPPPASATPPPDGASPTTTAAPTTTAPTGDPGITPATRPSGGEAATPGAVDPSSPPPTPAPTTVPTTTQPAGPVRVMVVGDSIGDNLAYGLQQWSATNGRLVVDNQSILGCMVSRGGERQTSGGKNWPVPAHCEDFATAWPAKIAAFQPDVVLVSTGHGEMWERRVDGWPTFRAPTDPIFDAWILEEYRKAVEVASASGARVVWVAPPCVKYRAYSGFLDETDGNARMAYLNKTLIPRLARQASIVVGDLYSLLCPTGTFTDTVLGIAEGRPDGVHVNGPTAIAIADQYLGPMILATAGRS